MADKAVERIKEQIKYETEVFRAALLITAATIGGTLSLFLGTLTPLRTVLAGAGILVSIVGVVGVWRQDRIIRTLIARIEENPK
jgi:uncharacterized membrane protein YgaE (UPF0421/DUF939 family)